jgi:hypothetical protein
MFGRTGAESGREGALKYPTNLRLQGCITHILRAGSLFGTASDCRLTRWGWPQFRWVPGAAIPVSVPVRPPEPFFRPFRRQEYALGRSVDWFHGAWVVRDRGLKLAPGSASSDLYSRNTIDRRSLRIDADGGRGTVAQRFCHKLLLANELGIATNGCLGSPALERCDPGMLES